MGEPLAATAAETALAAEAVVPRRPRHPRSPVTAVTATDHHRQPHLHPKVQPHPLHRSPNQGECLGQAGGSAHELIGLEMSGVIRVLGTQARSFRSDGITL